MRHEPIANEIPDGKEIPTAIYRHFDKENKLLYVGISLSAVNRLSQHKADANWYKEIAYVKIEYLKSREEAERAERVAIKTEKPKYNVRHNYFRGGDEYDTCADLVCEKEKIQYKLVSLNPVYSIPEAAKLLGMLNRDIVNLIVEERIGFFEHPTKRATYTVLKGRKEPYISGWQILDYLDQIGGLSPAYLGIKATRTYRK